MDTNTSFSDIRPPAPKVSPHRSRLPVAIVSVIILALLGYIVYAMIVKRTSAPKAPEVDYPLTAEEKLLILEDLENVQPANGARPLTDAERTKKMSDATATKPAKTLTEAQRLEILNAQ